MLRLHDLLAQLPGMSVDEWLDALAQLATSLRDGSGIQRPPLARLAGYYNHLADPAKGYEKDAAKLQEYLRQVYGWRNDVERLSEMVAS